MSYRCPSCGSINSAEPVTSSWFDGIDGERMTSTCSDSWHGDAAGRPTLTAVPEPQEIPVPDVSPALNPTPAVLMAAYEPTKAYPSSRPYGHIGLCRVHGCHYTATDSGPSSSSWRTPMSDDDIPASLQRVRRAMDDHLLAHRATFAANALADALRTRLPGHPWSDDEQPTAVARQLLADLTTDSDLLLVSTRDITHTTPEG